MGLRAQVRVGCETERSFIILLDADVQPTAVESDRTGATLGRL